MRLNRYLALCGLGSRRHCEELILAGRVEVNGRRVRQLATKVAETDEVTVDGRPVRPAEKPIYVMLNKPAGVVTTARDERQRKTVVDLVPERQRIFPVGRLDKDTEGLLLLTNDGELAYRLTHPRFEIDKVYRVRLDRSLKPADRRRLEQGVALDGRKTSPARLQQVDDVGREWLVTIHEGRKRQIRRMFSVLGYRVVYLRREQLGPVCLGDLPVGAWRYLTAAEVSHLKRAVELRNGDSQ
jgi:pseudouridine synthase